MKKITQLKVQNRRPVDSFFGRNNDIFERKFDGMPALVLNESGSAIPDPNTPTPTLPGGLTPTDVDSFIPPCPEADEEGCCADVDCLIDTFNRTTDPGWGDADTGQGWTFNGTTGTLSSVDPGEASAYLPPQTSDGTVVRTSTFSQVAPTPCIQDHTVEYYWEFNLSPFTRTLGPAWRPLQNVDGTWDYDNVEMPAGWGGSLGVNPKTDKGNQALYLYMSPTKALVFAHSLDTEDDYILNNINFDPPEVYATPGGWWSITNGILTEYVEPPKPFTFNAGTIYAVRALRDSNLPGTSLSMFRAKMWVKDDPEPINWQFEQYSNSQQTSSAIIAGRKVLQKGTAFGGGGAGPYDTNAGYFINAVEITTRDCTGCAGSATTETHTTSDGVISLNHQIQYIISVNIDGMIAIENVDYTYSGNVISSTSSFPEGATVTVKYVIA